MTRLMKRGLSVAVLCVVSLWIGNTSLFVSGLEAHTTRLISHRGVHHIYTGSDRSNDSCHAAPVEPIMHSFIENTVPSMREAFRLGADVVELDVHLTADKVFAVFHDWTLECRTNGSGVTYKQTFSDLQGLDLGYNLDDGTGAFALRGRGVGLLTSLSDVLQQDLGGQFLINFKSRRETDGTALAALLNRETWRSQIFGVYGGAEPTRKTIASVSGMRGFDKASVKGCLLRYVAIGWSGYVPKVCRDTFVLVPQNVAKFLWGWPHRFTNRLKSAGSEVILAGDYDGSGYSSGIDDAESFAKVPEAFDGYVWTNRIELIGPLNTE